MKAVAVALTLALTQQFAFAWGDDGHKVVALIAEHYLSPDVRNTVTALLAQDADPLTQHDIASEATWADKYRNQHRETGNWHFVDIEIDNPDISSACAGRPPLPLNTVASNGPPACILDKIQQFSDELAKSGTDPEERLIALKFLLHFVGDLHQPLHSSDNHDRVATRSRSSSMVSRRIPVTNCMRIGTRSSCEPLDHRRRSRKSSWTRSLQIK